jgi:hypothetical protein
VFLFLVYSLKHHNNLAKFEKECRLILFGSEGCEHFHHLKISAYVLTALQEEVLGKMTAPSKSDVPLITPNELSEGDGFVFGFPTRFGMMAAQSSKNWVFSA